MRQQSRRRPGSGKAKSKVQKKQKIRGEEQEPASGDAFFLEDDDDAEKQISDEEGEEFVETAEEKRLRLELVLTEIDFAAKAYLKQLRSSGASLGNDDVPGAGEEGDLDDEALAAKLKQQAQEAGGYLQRQIADRVSVPDQSEASTSGFSEVSSAFHRCHRGAVTALALTSDDSAVYSVGKEGSITKLDMATGLKSTIFKPKKGGSESLPNSGPDWVKRGPRHMHSSALLAAAVSSDGQLLAVGGGDRKVHVWDTRANSLLQSFPGHKDAITGLAFRHGTHELYSASYDRSIKLWSLDDRAYVDTLFGHQAEILAVDALRQERIVSSGYDHTCRVWKIAEESQLIYRSHDMAIDCCRYVTGTEWITGGNGGTLSLWTQLKKKPAWSIRNAHGGSSDTTPEAGWIQSVAVCRGTDLAASGAADGKVRLWQVKRGPGVSKTLEPLDHFPAFGFVNCLAIANNGRFVLAGLGQEPRLGRWGRAKTAQCGVLYQPLLISEPIEV